LGIDPNATTRNFDNSPDKRQSDAGLFDVGVELVEQAKNPFMELRVDTYPIIAYKQDVVLFLVQSRCADLDPWITGRWVPTVT